MIVGKCVRLQPNNSQKSDFIRFAGTSRFSWNESKAYYEKVYKEEKRYVNLSELMRHMQDLKHNNPKFSWLNDVPEAITKQAMKDLLECYKKAYQIRKMKNEFDSDKYFPRFKKKGKCEESFYQRTDVIRKVDDTHIKISGIKKPVKCSKLKGIDLPQHIYNPRIKFDGKYWYLSYSYEIKNNQITAFDRKSLGIDVGIKDFAIFSDGRQFRNINKDNRVKVLYKRLKHIQRLISKKYEQNAIEVNGRKLYIKTNNIEKLEKKERLIYRRISNIRKSYMYLVINEAVKTKPHNIVIEDLNIRGMMQNPKLARAIHEENLYKFRQVLTYKCQSNGINLIVADRFYPSSKTCSCCGYKKTSLGLSQRIYRCDNCGFLIDRDINAAINLENYAELKLK